MQKVIDIPEEVYGRMSNSKEKRDIGSDAINYILDGIENEFKTKCIDHDPCICEDCEYYYGDACECYRC